MLNNKKGLDMGDWFQIIFAIFVIALSIIFFVGTKSNITNKINQYAEDSLEKAEGSRVLLDYINSADSNGRKAIDLLSLAISKNDYKEFDQYTNDFFKARYKDPSKVTWMLRVENSLIHEVDGENFGYAGTKKKISSLSISLPNGEIAIISLHAGKDITIFEQLPGGL